MMSAVHDAAAWLAAILDFTKTYPPATDFGLPVAVVCFTASVAGCAWFGGRAYERWRLTREE